MPEPEFVIHVSEPMFTIGAKPGDDILIRPGGSQPVTIIRAVRPAYGELAAALSEGRASCANLSTDEALRVLVALAGEMPAPLGKRRRRGSGKGKRMALVPRGAA